MSSFPFALLGAHRGGRQLLASLHPDAAARLGPRWLIADPQADRAQQLAEAVHRRFPGTLAQAFPIIAQAAVPASAPDAHIVLATDTLWSIRESLAMRVGRAASFQIVGRGPGGAAGSRLGIQGTLLAGDRERDLQVGLLLAGLERLTSDGSSRALTAPDPLLGATLGPLRDQVTAQTALHLLHAERDPWDLPGAPLSITVAGHPLPATVHALPPDTRPAEAALELADRIPSRAWSSNGPPTVLVVLLLGARIELLSVSDTARRRVTGRTILAPEPAALMPRPEPARFTD